MPKPLILASGSEIRAEMLRRAGLAVEVMPARVDEDSVKQGMLADQAAPRDIADLLAEMKAAKVAGKRPDALVLGCDQVLDFDGTLLSKPETPDAAIAQLTAMSGQRHKLLSACVAFEEGKPVWRHVGVVTLSMRALSETYIEDYVARNWPSMRQSVGCYKLEEEGSRLFTTISGDYFTVLGLPLLPLLNWLALRGEIAT
ncbi:Maf family protein [Marinovum sp.]|uniref:Maf family protein n=1 Tax=Marinovum sp. TaxID=2024839 RepID=UPI002B27AC46|nr:Maf family nucleotide pyrophosphatase [Marinovum sp.]